MKIASVTLTGNNQNIIADAISSVVDSVDLCIVVDTGSTDQSMQIAKSIAGDKFVPASFPWINDFAAARNYCLKAATEAGADWALVLDTDERMIFNDEDVRKALNETNAGSVIVNCTNNTYGKVRFIKLPNLAEYMGPTHEVYPGYKVGSITLEKMKFDELGKNAEQLKFKFERDVEILLKHTSENPQDPRWFYYLGDSYKNLNRLHEAIAAYEKCWQLNGWDEESAWCMYRAAECFISLNDLTKAIECCAKGLARHPAIAELSWLAGWCSYKKGLFDKAIAWCKISLSLGYPEGIASMVHRIGFRHPPGLWEGPYDVLRWTYREILKQNPNNEEIKKLIATYDEKCDQIYKRRLSGKD
jgi:glycosyltransferase involved in cell wall biosynthesis